MYGVGVEKLKKNTTHQSIIEIYDKLEHKLTQNLLLKKENDEISLQISTIKQLFGHVVKMEYSSKENNHI